MKKIFTLSFVVIIALIVTTKMFGQTSASATWQMTSVTTTSVSTSGSVNATAEAYNNMEFNAYNTPLGPLGVNSQRNRIIGGSWPGDAAYVASRYIQFTVSPQTGNDLTVTNISIPIGASGGGNMRAEIYYSTDGFATSTKLNPATLVLPSGAYLSPTPNYNVSISVPSGSTLSLRVYPFYTTSSTGKYVVLQNLVISGTTVVSTTYNITITTVGQGGVSSSPAGPYLANTPVSLTAASSPGWFFQGWTGDITGTDSNKTITVTSNMNTTVTFRRYVTLATNVSGSGTVTKTPSSASYLNGSNVTLTASSSPGWDFTNWSGNFSGTDSSTTVTLGDNNQSVTATFNQYAKLTVVQNGPGTYSVAPALSPNRKYLFGSIITLTPILNPNWYVSKILVNNKSVPVVTPFVDTLNAHTTIEFTVSPKYTQYTLSVITLGNGTVAASPAPYNGTYDKNTPVVLTATPAAGSIFVGWGGSITAHNAIQQILMTENKLVFSTFQTTTTGDTPSSATWPLAADGSVVTMGDVTATAELFKGTEVNGYTGFNGAQRVRMAGTNNTWAAGLTSQIDTVYVQFSVSPVTGKNFHIRSITLNVGASSSNTMHANIAYSTNANFSSPTLISYSTGNTNNYLTSGGTTSVTLYSDIIVNDGQTLYLRVYPWAEYAAPATGKYVTLRNVVISNADINGNTGGTRTVVLPKVDPAVVNYVTFNSAVVTSLVTSDGGDDVTDKGICWGTKSNPATSENKVALGNGIGQIAASISGLTAGTKYYFRGYATNSIGTAYGKQDSVKTNSLFHKLFTNVIGSGKIVCDPDSPDQFYEKNVTVKLNVVPAAGWQFVEWTGDVTGKNASVSVKIDTIKNVTAKFQVAVGVNDEEGLPTQFALNQNYPNPFNPSTRISYALPERASVKLKVFDVLAREVAELVNATKEPGRYEVSFDGSNLPSGVYFYKLEAGSFVQVKKLLLVK